MSCTANDDRSDSMNPNNSAYDDAQDNCSNQPNPNNERYQGQADKDEDEDLAVTSQSDSSCFSVKVGVYILSVGSSLPNILMEGPKA